jgi:biopolymer transport protein ExbD
MTCKMLTVFAILATVVFSSGCSHPTKTLTAPNSATPAHDQVQIVELAVGANGTYVWRGRSWQVSELEDALKSESSQIRVSQVHLLSSSYPSTMQNLIEIGQIASDLGAKAFYERNGELKSISVGQ